MSGSRALVTVLAGELRADIPSDAQLVILEENDLELLLTLDRAGAWHERYRSADQRFTELERLLVILPIMFKKVVPLKTDTDIAAFARRVSSYAEMHEDELLQAFTGRLDVMVRTGERRYIR